MITALGLGLRYSGADDITTTLRPTSARRVSDVHIRNGNYAGMGLSIANVSGNSG